MSMRNLRRAFGSGFTPVFEPLESRLLLDAHAPLAGTADAYEPNDQSWAAKSVTLDGTGHAAVTGLTVHSASDVDWFSFAVPYGVNGDVHLTISNVSGGLKGDVRIYDSVIGTLSDQYGGIFTTLYGPKQEAQATNGNDTVAMNWSGLKAATTYYARVSGLTSTTGGYNLSFAADMLSPDGFEPNNTSATATNVTLLVTGGAGLWTQGNLNIHTGSDVDWYRIATPANTDGDMKVTVSNLTGGLAGMVTIYKQYTWGLGWAGGAAFASWTGGSVQAIAWGTQPLATYYICVDNFYQETGNYQLKVQLPLDMQGPDAYGGNDFSWSAAHVTPGSLTNLHIRTCVDVEWFSFVATCTGTEQIDISGVSGGLVADVGLYNSPVASLADQYGGIYSTIFAPMGETTAGGANQSVSLIVPGLVLGRTYYIRISGAEGTTGIYQTNFFQKELVSLAVSGPGSVNGNSSAGYMLLATFDDATTEDVTTVAAWTQTSPWATIGYNTGVLTVFHLIADSATTITATYGGMSGSKGVALVYQHQVINFWVTGPGTVAQNSTGQYTANELWDNGTVHDVTTLVTWAQISPHATISTGGLLSVGTLNPLLPNEPDIVTATDGVWTNFVSVLLTSPPAAASYDGLYDCSGWAQIPGDYQTFNWGNYATMVGGRIDTGGFHGSVNGSGWFTGTLEVAPGSIVPMTGQFLLGGAVFTVASPPGPVAALYYMRKIA